jgi:hypothetical protein
MTRIKKDVFSIRVIREIRGEKIFTSMNESGA